MWRLSTLAAVVALAVGVAACSKFRHAVGPDEGRFVASRRGASYHTLQCGMAKRMRRQNRLYYRTGDDAYKDGFTPCQVCHPERRSSSQESRVESSVSRGESRFQ